MALPDYTFLDGFDKYVKSPAILASETTYEGLITLGEWTALDGNTQLNVTTALSGTGFAMSLNSASSGYVIVYKTLPSNYARAVGGITMLSKIFNAGVQFMDGAGTAQVSLLWNSSGKLEAKRGGQSGTLIGTSTASFSSGTSICLEWDITFHTSAGIIKVWFNGAADAGLTLTGLNTSQSGNNRFNTFGLGANNLTQFDHLYLWAYTASGGSETPALTNPIIETSYVTSQVSASWSPGPSILGEGIVGTASSSTSATGANILRLKRLTATVAGNLDSVSVLPATTSAGAKLKAVLYADSGGVAGTLIQAGTEIVGVTSGTTVALPMGAVTAITAGTSYWIGFITDTTLQFGKSNTSLEDYQAANTYSSGAPGTAPAMTGGQDSAVMYGNLSGVSSNWDQVSHGAPTSSKHYNTSATVGNQDLYGFANLTFTPSAIYSVAVKAISSKTDTGTRTIDLLTSSGAVTSTGSNSGFGLSTSDIMFSSYFSVDPNTGVSWTPAGLNAANHGIKIAS